MLRVLMMKCQHCRKKDVVVHLTEIEDKEKTFRGHKTSIEGNS